MKKVVIGMCIVGSIWLFAIVYPMIDEFLFYNINSNYIPIIKAVVLFLILMCGFVYIYNKFHNVQPIDNILKYTVRTSYWLLIIIVAISLFLFCYQKGIYSGLFPHVRIFDYPICGEGMEEYKEYMSPDCQELDNCLHDCEKLLFWFDQKECTYRCFQDCSLTKLKDNSYNHQYYEDYQDY